MMMIIHIIYICPCRNILLICVIFMIFMCQVWVKQDLEIITLTGVLQVQSLPYIYKGRKKHKYKNYITAQLTISILKTPLQRYRSYKVAWQLAIFYYSSYLCLTFEHCSFLLMRFLKTVSLHSAFNDHAVFLWQKHLQFGHNLICFWISISCLMFP